MEILEAIKKEDIPTDPRINPDYTELYQRVLSSNGMVVPVRFETRKEAKKVLVGITNPRGRGLKLGIKATLRGTTVFVFKA